MPMPVYERRIGPHVAERIRVEAGGDEDERYAALVAAGTGNWLQADEPAEAPADAPKRRGRPPTKKA